MPNYDTMRGYLDTITAGQLQAALDYLADDVVVHVGGHHAMSGDYRGKAEWGAALSKMASTLGTLRVEEHDLLVSDDHAVVLDTWHVDRDGETTSVDHAIIYHVSGGKITEIWIVSADQSADDALFA